MKKVSKKEAVIKAILAKKALSKVTPGHCISHCLVVG